MMKKIKWILGFTIILGVASPCHAQWAMTYGGIGSDLAHAIQQTVDGGFVVAGEYNAPDSFDVWVLKLNSDGTIAWQKTYGGSSHERGHSIQQTTDGGYVVAGYTKSFGAGSSDFWVLKLNSDGTVAWQKTYGGSSHERGHSIQQTTDGGYVVVGEYNATDGFDVLVLKLNSDGSMAWQKTYGGKGSDFAHSVQQTTDGGFIVAGYTDSFDAGGSDFWVLKLNSDGTVAWQKTYGGSGHEISKSIQQTADGGFVVAGMADSFGAGGEDVWILKLNSDGTVAWQKTYGGKGSEIAYSIQQTVDGDYIVAGTTTSFGAGGSDLLAWLRGGDFWVLKLNSDGTVAWQKTYGGKGSDLAHSIQQTVDGGFVVAGKADSFGAGLIDFWILKLDKYGEIPDCKVIGESNANMGQTSAVIQDTNDTPQNTSLVFKYTKVVPQDSLAKTDASCF